MMTQSVMTQAANLSQTNVGAYSSRKQSRTGDFDLFMDKNLNSGSTDPSETKYDTAQSRGKKDGIDRVKDTSTEETDYKQRKTKDKSDAGEDIKPNDVASVSDSNVGSKAVHDQVKAALKNLADEATQGADSAKGKEQKDLKGLSELLEQLMGMFQSIKEAVMEVLQLSPEEMEKMLSDLGLTTADLADSEALKQLALYDAGKTNVLDFLTDEELAATMKQLTDVVETIKAGTGLNLTEEQLSKTILELREQTAVLLASKENPQIAVADDVAMKAATNEAVADPDTDDIDAVNKPIIEVIKYSEQEEGNTKSDTGAEDNSHLDTSKQYETFVENLTKTSQDTTVSFTGETVRITELRDIANQIIERIRVVIKPEETSMELQLNPENIGKVNLTVQTKGGVMTAQFVVQNEVAKEAIESQLQTLKDTLNLQGVKVEEIEVTVASYTLNRDNQSNQDERAAEKKKGRRQGISLEEAVTMSEDVVEDSTEILTGLSGTNLDETI